MHSQKIMKMLSSSVNLHGEIQISLSCSPTKSRPDNARTSLGRLGLKSGTGRYSDNRYSDSVNFHFHKITLGCQMLKGLVHWLASCLTSWTDSRYDTILPNV